MRPTPRSLILDLLSTLSPSRPEAGLPARALVASGALFDLSESSLRVALTRLRAAGQIERDERGRYRLGRGAEAVRRHVVSWRSLPERAAAWSGGWVAVHGAPSRRGPAARAAARALRLLGFRELRAQLHLRPDNLRGGAERLRGELRELGLPEDALVATLGGLDADTEARASSLWEVEALTAGYASSLRALAESTRRLPELPVDEAMAESFELGGAVIRQLALDPLLPEPIAPTGERDALVAALREYDRLGRSFWATFLSHYDLPPRRRTAPAAAAAGLAATSASAPERSRELALGQGR